MWYAGWFVSSAWGSSWSIEWSIGTGASNDFAVNAWWSVISVAFWEFGLVLFNFNWGPFGLGECLVLLIVEFLTLHSNILSEIFITVHSSGEEFIISWSASDTVNTGVNAC